MVMPRKYAREGVTIRSYSLDGRFKREWDSLSECIEELEEETGLSHGGVYSGIYGVLSKKTKQWRGEIYRAIEDDADVEGSKDIDVSDIIFERRDKGCGTHRSQKYNSERCIIRQYTLEGELVSEYRSMREALCGLSEMRGAEAKYNGIYRCLRGKSKTYLGYRWMSNFGRGSGLLQGCKQARVHAKKH